MSARAPRGAAPPPWDPIRDLRNLKDRMNRLLENVLRRGDFAPDGLAGWSPAVDLREDHEGFVLSAELPGVRREDIRIRVEGGTLTLEGERLLEPEARAADPLRIERSYGAFSRAFPLPAAVDASKARARFRHGVLEVFVPKAAEAPGRAIRVPVS